MFHNVEVEELSHALQLSSCFSLCPTMDLVSFQLNDNVVWVYRRGNEKVWDIEHEETVSTTGNDHGNTGNDLTTRKIKDLAWKPDGKFFAVVSTNGLIELFDTMNGMLIRSIQLKMEVSCVRWFKRSDEVMHGLKPPGIGGILDDIIITNSLPSLNFNSDNSSLVASKEEDDESMLDFLIAGSTEGSLSCVFSGIFVVENLTLSEIFENSDILDILSNSSLSNHFILLNTPTEKSLSILKVDTDFIHKDKKFTKILLICSKLLNLIDHIKSSIKQIDGHYKPYFDYTIRIIELLRREIKEEETENESAAFKGGKENDENVEDTENNINSTKKDNVSNNADPVYDLYDLLLTGSLSSATRKWLTDYLSDRGVKRWTKLGRTYFDNARSSIYNDLVSCLHHIIVFLTDLKGLSQWTSNDTSLYTLDIEECIKISQSYLKYSYKFMMELNDSQRYFEQTIIWLSSILSELTADEKLNVSFRTNDITKFLMFISSKMNTVKSQERNEDQSSIHDSSKVNEFTKYLDNVLNSLFSKIKNDIKSKFKLANHSLLTSGEDSSFSNVSMKIFDEGNKGQVLMLKDSTKIVMKQFDLLNLEVKTFDILREETEVITDLKIIAENKILVLFTDCVIMYTILFDTKKAVTRLKYVLQEHLCGTDANFEAGFLAVNNERKMFCILDRTKKKYIWISY